MTDRYTVLLRLALVLIILASGILAGCAAKKYVMEEKPKGVTLEYKMPVGGVLEYKQSEDSEQTMEMMGMSIETTSRRTYGFTLTPKGREGDDYEVYITINSMDASVKSPQGEMTADTGPVVGKSFTMIMSPMGKEVDVSGADEIKYGLGPQGERSMTSDFQAFFPDLPATPVDIGDTWTTLDTVTVNEGGIDIMIIAESVNTLAGFETVSGMECAKVSEEVTGTVTGEGESQGAQVSFAGTMSGTETWYFAYEEGVYVDRSAVMFSKSNIEVKGPQEMSFPMSQRMNFDTKLVR